MPLDTEKFIKEVEARPCLWNNNSPEYERKELKTRGWKELCDIFVPNYPAMDSAAQNREAIGLQRKWKSLRDSFNRELKARRLDNEGAADARRRPCPYFEQLSFLRPILEAKKRETTQQPSVGPSNQNQARPEPEVPVHGIPCKRKRSNGPILEEGPGLIAELNGNHDRDSDIYFFRSMLPYFGRLSPNCKINLKLAFMAMIKKYCKRDTVPPVVNEEEGTSRTTPAVLNGSAGSSSNAQVEQDNNAEGDLEDIEDYTSDTSPGLSAGYTDESVEADD